jgi:formylglycine-generating enzyme required for sulfatase activity
MNPVLQPRLIETEAQQSAQSKLMVFKRQYPIEAEWEKVWLLAGYAAFPLAITSHLLYCLREEFVPECPWYSVPDLLLSVLCESVGYDLYEMLPEVRNALLEHLLEQKGNAAFDALETYLLDYIQYRLSKEPDERARNLGDDPHPQWIAMIFTRNQRESIETIRQTLLKISDETDWRTRFKFAALVDRYADLPILSEFRHQLLDWAQRTAKGETISPTESFDESALPPLKQLNFEEVVLVEEQHSNDDALQTKVIQTVEVDRRGRINNRPEYSIYYFEEKLGEGVRPLEMIAIRSGKFLMGSSEKEEGRYENESPQHIVMVPPFFISKYSITQGQWRLIAQLNRIEIDLNSDPSRFEGEDRPVECVSWHEAVEFCKRLCTLTGREEYRLPTEAEWEYACRGGSQTPFAYGETITSDLVNFDGGYTYGSASKGKYREQTTNVGSFPPNAFGLCDMHGNVWEWCQDSYHDNYEDAPLKWGAWITNNDKNSRRILRGGSWVNNPVNCRSADRGRDKSNEHYSINGFRVVCAVPRNS